MGSFDLDALKNQADDDNVEIMKEWFADGQWEIDDEMMEAEEEDWDRWLDYFD